LRKTVNAKCVYTGQKTGYTLIDQPHGHMGKVPTVR